MTAVAWIIEHGGLLVENKVLHKVDCALTNCANVRHMELGTAADQIKRVAKPGRGKKGAKWRRPASKCAAGHFYSKENTFYRSDGFRRCRACHRLQMRRARAKAATKSLQLNSLVQKLLLG